MYASHRVLALCWLFSPRRVKITNKTSMLPNFLSLSKGRRELPFEYVLKKETKMSSRPELTGQTVVVIGGSSGIGLETARRARTEGANVILTARDAARLEQPASELRAIGTAAFDATDSDALARFFDSIQTPIDHAAGFVDTP